MSTGVQMMNFLKTLEVEVSAWSSRERLVAGRKEVAMLLPREDAW
jgi:hypothetical protein